MPFRLLDDSMTRYTNADFDDESVNSVQLTEGISTSATHIRYHAGSSVWNLRSPLEKLLLMIVALLLFVVFVLAIILHSAEHHQSTPKTTTDKDVCLNESCIHIASNILESMDSSLDPCDDFYAYACNGWIKANPIPDGKSQWGTFLKLAQENLMIVKRVLEQPIEQIKSKAEQKAKLYYESCMDSNETVEKLGAQPLLDELKTFGGWNLTFVSKESLQPALQSIQNRYNLGAFFAYSVGEDDKNSSRYVLQIDQSGLTLPTRDHYLNKTEHPKVLEAYLECMTRIGVLLGGQENRTRAQMKAVIDFETRLANITTPNEKRRDENSIYHNMSVLELNKKVGFMDWRMFFEDALKLVNRKVTLKEPVVVYAIEYMTNLTLLIKEYQQTPEGRLVLHDYMVWKLVRNFSVFLSKPFRDAFKVLRVAMMGSDSGEEPQWHYCIEDTKNVLGFAIGAIFVREVFHPDSKAHVEVMINNVRQAFIRNFANLQWMDEETRKVAIVKADAMDDMIGYPDFIKDVAELNRKYASLEVRNDTYFRNNINAAFFNLKKDLEKINEKVNKTTWSMFPSAVNAYYTPTKNQMVFPAGILQNPFYDPSFPASLNYGAMGVVMGHELTHGFDDQGRLYDKNGNLNRWWNNQTIDRFKNRTKCVEDQYSSYKINGKPLNGNQTLGENIADNGGLKAAYHAYLDLIANQPKPQQLPGLPLNDKQLFFLSFAQVWCSTYTKEAISLEIEKDSHSPAKFRVIGALSNLREFSNEFGCRPGTKMNPVKKCEVW